MRKISAVIAAAGQSSRMNLKDGGSKQFIEIGGKPVILRTLEIFNASPYISEIIISARGSDIGRIEAIAGAFEKVKNITEGGATRTESVAKAVKRVSRDADYIAVHDGARCFITLEDIEKVALRAFETGAAAAGCKITDTVKRIDGENIVGTLEREFLRAVQTPQIFLKSWYTQALETAALNAPDDCYILESAGYKVAVVECSKYNLKITDGQDLEFFNLISEKNMKYKIGHGYDAHKLADNRKLILGGVEIEHERGLAGHSDADVLIHAIIDALLGAAGLGDIGALFPDSDNKYKDISSLILLEKAAELVKKDYAIANIDCTVVAEKPKLAQYRQAMKENLCKVLRLDSDDMNIKATTEEGLGFTGRREGIAAYAVCILERK